MLPTFFRIEEVEQAWILVEGDGMLVNEANHNNMCYWALK